MTAACSRAQYLCSAELVHFPRKNHRSLSIRWIGILAQAAEASDGLRLPEIDVNTESASVPTAHLRISVDLKPGEETNAIGTYPGDESKRLVLVVERVR